MAKGQAHGRDRDYQVLARDIIRDLRREQALAPYSGDGIDVPFSIAGTVVTFDVALQDPDGRLALVECKRWAGPVKQDGIFAFAGKLEALRKELRVEAAGLFVARTRYQEGALKAATCLGISAATCEQDQRLAHYVISYKRYDPARDKIIQDARAGLTAELRPTARLGLVVLRRDGPIEDLGVV